MQLILTRTARLRRFCNIIQGGEYNQKVPVQTTKTVAAVHSEAGDMATGVTEPVYGSVTPEAVKLGALVKFSRELLDDSPLALLNLVTRDIGEAIGELEDLSILDGATFTDSLFADVGTGTAWTDATTTLATLDVNYYELPQRFRANATWIINEAAAAVLTAITATDGRPMLQEFNPAPRAIDDVGGQVGELIGRPVLVFPTGATGVPADEAFFRRHLGLLALSARGLPSRNEPRVRLRHRSGRAARFTAHRRHHQPVGENAPLRLIVRRRNRAGASVYPGALAPFRQIVRHLRAAAMPTRPRARSEAVEGSGV